MSMRGLLIRTMWAALEQFMEMKRTLKDVEDGDKDGEDKSKG